MNRSVLFLWLFSFVCASTLYLFTLDLELGHINRVIKGTPIILLMALAWVLSRAITRRFLMVALSFSLLGDILLSFYVGPGFIFSGANHLYAFIF